MSEVSKKQKDKRNLFVKVSGDERSNKKVLRKIAEYTKKYSVIVLIGEGSDTNKAFQKKEYKIEFCPLGRVFHFQRERKLARRILEKNQAEMQDLLDKKGITARVEIPFQETASVLCPEKGGHSCIESLHWF